MWLAKEEIQHDKIVSSNMRQWLLHTQNMTETLKRAGLDFHLKVLDQSFQEMYDDETFILENEYNKQAWIRQVFSFGDTKPLVYARVVVPHKTYSVYSHILEKLGTQSIGNAFLYATPNIRRCDFEYQKLTPDMPLFEALQKWYLPQDDFIYWARRSVFVLPKGNILITEILLEHLPQYPHADPV